jgi:hypothetical protein
MNLFVKGVDSPFSGRVKRVALWYHSPPTAARRSGIGRALESAAYSTARAFARNAVPFWIALRHQAILIAYGNTWSRHRWEPWLYRLAGLHVIVVFHGSDIRPPYLDGFQSPDGIEPDWQRLYEKTRFNHRRARMAEAAAHMVIAQMGHCHFLTRPFVVFEQIGIPVSVDVPLGPSPEDGSDISPRQSVRVVHAPSSPATKGTQQIREIVTSLQMEGLSIDFVQLVGRSNVDVVAELANADIAVDQLWCDYPGGAFAVEAGLHGVAVIVGCNFLPDAADRYRNREMPPFLLVPPEEVKGTLRNLVIDAALRDRLGRTTSDFLRRERHPKQVAERYRHLIEAGARPEQLAHPREGGDLNGGFAPRAHVHGLVRGMIERFGRSSLLLEDRSDLKQSIDTVTIPSRRS